MTSILSFASFLTICFLLLSSGTYAATSGDEIDVSDYFNNNKDLFGASDLFLENLTEKHIDIISKLSDDQIDALRNLERESEPIIPAIEGSERAIPTSESKGPRMTAKTWEKIHELHKYLKFAENREESMDLLKQTIKLASENLDASLDLDPSLVNQCPLFSQDSICSRDDFAFERSLYLYLEEDQTIEYIDLSNLFEKAVYSCYSCTSDKSVGKKLVTMGAFYFITTFEDYLKDLYESTWLELVEDSGIDTQEQIQEQKLSRLMKLGKLINKPESEKDNSRIRLLSHLNDLFREGFRNLLKVRTVEALQKVENIYKFTKLANRKTTFNDFIRNLILDGKKIQEIRDPIERERQAIRSFYLIQILRLKEPQSYPKITTVMDLIDLDDEARYIRFKNWLIRSIVQIILNECKISDLSAHINLLIKLRTINQNPKDDPGLPNIPAGITEEELRGMILESNINEITIKFLEKIKLHYIEDTNEGQRYKMRSIIDSLNSLQKDFILAKDFYDALNIDFPIKLVAHNMALVDFFSSYYDPNLSDVEKSKSFSEFKSRCSRLRLPPDVIKKKSLDVEMQKFANLEDLKAKFPIEYSADGLITRLIELAEVLEKFLLHNSINDFLRAKLLFIKIQYQRTDKKFNDIEFRKKFDSIAEKSTAEKKLDPATYELWSRVNKFTSFDAFLSNHFELKSILPHLYSDNPVLVVCNFPYFNDQILVEKYYPSPESANEIITFFKLARKTKPEEDLDPILCTLFADNRVKFLEPMIHFFKYAQASDIYAFFAHQPNLSYQMVLDYYSGLSRLIDYVSSHEVDEEADKLYAELESLKGQIMIIHPNINLYQISDLSSMFQTHLLRITYKLSSLLSSHKDEKGNSLAEFTDRKGNSFANFLAILRSEVSFGLQIKISHFMSLLDLRPEHFISFPDLPKHFTSLLGLLPEHFMSLLDLLPELSALRTEFICAADLYLSFSKMNFDRILSSEPLKKKRKGEVWTDLQEGIEPAIQRQVFYSGYYLNKYLILSDKLSRCIASNGLEIFLKFSDFQKHINGDELKTSESFVHFYDEIVKDFESNMSKFQAENEQRFIKFESLSPKQATSFVAKYLILRKLIEHYLLQVKKSGNFVGHLMDVDLPDNLLSHHMKNIERYQAIFELASLDVTDNRIVKTYEIARINKFDMNKSATRDLVIACNILMHELPVCSIILKKLEAFHGNRYLALSLPFKLKGSLPGFDEFYDLFCFIPEPKLTVEKEKYKEKKEEEKKEEEKKEEEKKEEDRKKYMDRLSNFISQVEKPDDTFKLFLNAALDAFQCVNPNLFRVFLFLKVNYVINTIGIHKKSKVNIAKIREFFMAQRLLLDDAIQRLDIIALKVSPSQKSLAPIDEREIIAAIFEGCEDNINLEVHYDAFRIVNQIHKLKLFTFSHTSDPDKLLDALGCDANYKATMKQEGIYKFDPDVLLSYMATLNLFLSPLEKLYGKAVHDSIKIGLEVFERGKGQFSERLLSWIFGAFSFNRLYDMQNELEMTLPCTDAKVINSKPSIIYSKLTDIQKLKFKGYADLKALQGFTSRLANLSYDKYISLLSNADLIRANALYYAEIFTLLEGVLYQTKRRKLPEELDPGVHYKFFWNYLAPYFFPFKHDEALSPPDPNLQYLKIDNLEKFFDDKLKSITDNLLIKEVEKYVRAKGDLVFYNNLVGIEMLPSSDVMLRCRSIRLAEDKVKDDLDVNYQNQGKVLIPASYFKSITSQEKGVVYQIKVQHGSAVTHLTLEAHTPVEGVIYLPDWAMKSLGVSNETLVNVSNEFLPLGSFAQVQFKLSEIDKQIEDKDKVLTSEFSTNYRILSVGDVIQFILKEGEKEDVCEVLVKEVGPDYGRHAIVLVNVDLNIDFLPDDKAERLKEGQNAAREQKPSGEVPLTLPAQQTIPSLPGGKEQPKVPTKVVPAPSQSTGTLPIQQPGKPEFEFEFEDDEDDS